MTKFITLMLLFGATYVSAENVNIDSEIGFEQLFSEEDLAAFKDEKLDEEEILFDEISQAEAQAEEVFQ
jgi:hypothetical protein